MKPDELREWAHAIRLAIQEFLPNRDSKVWSYALSGSAALMVLAATDPTLFPPGLADRILHWGGAAGIVAAKMGWSWAGSPAPKDGGQ